MASLSVERIGYVSATGNDMSSGDLMTEERVATLVSGGTGAWTDGTTIQMNWTFHFLGSRAGHYKAAPVKIVVRPSDPSAVTGATLRIVERYRYSGAIAKQADFRLRQNGTSFETEFEWDSTVNNPDQEILVQLETTSPDGLIMLLADPIARRRDFLISFSTVNPSATTRSS